LAEKDAQKLPVAGAVEGFLDTEERRVEGLAVLLRATVEGLQKEDRVVGRPVRHEAALLHRDLYLPVVGELTKAQTHHSLQDLHQNRLQHGEPVVTRVTLGALVSFSVTDWPLREAVYQAWYQARYIAYQW
jgi:hypothetical protein